MTVVFAVHALADARARAAPRRGARRGAVRASGARRCPRFPAAPSSGRPGPCSGCCSGTSRARSAATASSTSPAPASSSSSATSTSRSVNEFADGGLHPGLRVPALAGVPRADRQGRLRRPVGGRAARVDRARAARRARRLRGGLRALPPGRARRRVGRRGRRDRGDGGGARRLATPRSRCPRRRRARSSCPAALALAFAAMRDADEGAPRERRRSRRSCSPSSTRPTRSSSGSRSPASSPCAGPGGARTCGSGALALAALVVPGRALPRLAPPVVRRTASVSPDAHERARGVRALRRPAQRLGRPASGSRREVFGRSGAVAVAALLLIPFAALASRRRWAAYVVGGSLAVFAITLVPWLFTPFSDVVSLSQSRRLAGFIPFAFALAGGMGVLAALLGRFVVPLALVAGIVLQWQYPGDFGYALDEGGPAWATWIAVVGALVALVVGLWRLRSLETTAALASALLLLPTFVYGLSHWSPSPARTASPLTPGLVDVAADDGAGGGDRLLRSGVELPDRRRRTRLHLQRAARSCRRHDEEPSLRPPRRVAPLQPDRRPRDPAALRRDVARDRPERLDTRPQLPVAYRDGRYILYRLRTIGCHSMTRARTPLLAGLVTAAVLLASAAAVDGFRLEAEDRTSRCTRGTARIRARRTHPLPRLLLRVPARALSRRSWRRASGARPPTPSRAASPSLMLVSARPHRARLRGSPRRDDRGSRDQLVRTLGLDRASARSFLGSIALEALRRRSRRSSPSFALLLLVRRRVFLWSAFVLGVATAVQYLPGSCCFRSSWPPRSAGLGGPRSTPACSFAAGCAVVVLPFLVLSPGGIESSIRWQLDRHLQFESTFASIALLGHTVAGVSVGLFGEAASYALGGAPGARCSGCSRRRRFLAGLLLVWWRAPAARALEPTASCSRSPPRSPSSSRSPGSVAAVPPLARPARAARARRDRAPRHRAAGSRPHPHEHLVPRPLRRRDQQPRRRLDRPSVRPERAARRARRRARGRGVARARGLPE